MKRALLATGAVLLSTFIPLAGCSSGGGDLGRAETQRAFGVRMAKMNLWREAMFRFRRQVEIDPDDAMAHNNLAVASEANGDYETAAMEYREALRLDRSNQYIQKNYSRFTEFMQKSRKRESKEAEGVKPAAVPDAAPPAPSAPAMPDAASGAPPETAPPPPPTERPPGTNGRAGVGGRA